MSIFPEYFGSGSGGGKLRFQDFLASGTFTPSALLSLNGGQCFVLCVGGGGGGGTGSSGQGAGGGGGGGAVIVRPLVITSAQTITIGAGGAAGTAGSASSIGVLLSAPGGGAGANGDPSNPIAGGVGASGGGASGYAAGGGGGAGSPGGNFSLAAAEMLRQMAVPLLMGLLGADQQIRQGLCSRDRAALELTDSVAAAEVALAAVADH